MSNKINIEDHLFKKELWNYVYCVLKKKQKIRIAKKQYLILRLRSLGFTLNGIGKRFKVTRERIRQIQEKAINTLNYPKHKEQLI